LNLKRLGFFVFGNRAKRLTPRMRLNAQFFVVKVAREALKEMVEGAMLRKLESETAFPRSRSRIAHDT
jgi:hypothetical protein